MNEVRRKNGDSFTNIRGTTWVVRRGKWIKAGKSQKQIQQRRRKSTIGVGQDPTP